MANSPDVVVLGMPSSGKTVFLSVLGHQFTLAADDCIAAPLGFRMCANDPTTRNMVAANYTALEQKAWPKNTLEGQITPLQWDVFTGKRRVFRLSSMDISGETFRKAFGQEPEHAKPSRRSSDADDGLLGKAKEDDASGTKVDKAADALRNAVTAAKVVCLFVNISLPRDEQLLNFRRAVASMCSLLSENNDVARKTLVVLTQTHLHRGEIENTGGPVPYLGKIARDLMQILSDRQIPVITVSAVNEEDDDNHVPDTIASDGLFGFLLTVAGMITDDELTTVKNSYLAYLAARTRYRQRPCRPIRERMPLIQAFRNAGMAFHEACMDYLGNPGNFHEPGMPGERLPESTIAFYRSRTDKEPEISSATTEWVAPLRRDTIWDLVLRSHIWAEDADGTDNPLSLTGEVEARLSRPSSSTPRASLYGFETEELIHDGEAACEEDWIRQNLKDYRDLLLQDLRAAASVVKALQDETTSLEDMPEDALSYGEAVVRAETALLEANKALTDLRKSWAGNETSAPGPDRFVQLHNDIANCEAIITRQKEVHDAYLERLKCLRIARRRRKRVLFTLFALAFSIGALIAAKTHCQQKNREILRQIETAANAHDFALASSLTGAFISIPVLLPVEADELALLRHRIGMAQQIIDRKKAFDLALNHAIGIGKDSGFSTAQLTALAPNEFQAAQALLDDAQASGFPGDKPLYDLIADTSVDLDLRLDTLAASTQKARDAAEKLELAVRTARCAKAREDFKRAMLEASAAFKGNAYDAATNHLARAWSAAWEDGEKTEVKRLRAKVLASMETDRRRKEEQLNELVRQFDTQVEQAEEHIRKATENPTFQLDHVSHVEATEKLVAQATGLVQEIAKLSGNQDCERRLANLNQKMPKIIIIEGHLKNAPDSAPTPVDVSVVWGLFHFGKEPNVIEGIYPPFAKRRIFIRVLNDDGNRKQPIRVKYGDQTKPIIIEHSEAHPGINRRSVEFSHEER